MKPQKSRPGLVRGAGRIIRRDGTVREFEFRGRVEENRNDGDHPQHRGPKQGG